MNQGMRNREDVLRALSQTNLDVLTRRLIVYAASRRLPDPQQRVIRTIGEAIDGDPDHHHELYGKGLSLFAFLCHVIEK